MIDVGQENTDARRPRCGGNFAREVTIHDPIPVVYDCLIRHGRAVVRKKNCHAAVPARDIFLQLADHLGRPLPIESLFGLLDRQMARLLAPSAGGEISRLTVHRNFKSTIFAHLTVRDLLDFYRCGNGDVFVVIGPAGREVLRDCGRAAAPIGLSHCPKPAAPAFTAAASLQPAGTAPLP